MSTAKKLGQNMTKRAISPDKLKDISPPAIFHLDGDTPDAGSFHLLLRIRDKDILYMDGSSARILSMKRETFFRRWTGVVAYSTSKRVNNLYGALGGVIGIMIGFGLSRKIGHV